MPIIGAVDIVIALLTLFKPMRIISLYTFVWTLLTSVMRPIVGSPIWGFVERSSNFMVPLTLLYLRGFSTTFKELFK